MLVKKFFRTTAAAAVSAVFGLALCAPIAAHAALQTASLSSRADGAPGLSEPVKKPASAPKSAQKTEKKAAKKTVKKTAKPAAPRTGARPSQATLAGLRKTEDPLRLGSSVAYAVDQATGEELIVKNADVPLPIASVTKLMTALVIAQSDLPLTQKIRITREDYVRSQARSKLVSGMVMTREAVLKAALMASDNRAAHALARTFPGGKKAFVKAMNDKAHELGMTDSFFADPTGLDNRNHATARDLGKLVAAVYEHQSIRSASTAPMARLKAGGRTVVMQTTNRLIGDPSWDIGVQKTGFTTAAGRCMVVQSKVGERSLVFVVLDSPSNAARAQDMRTMRAYVESEGDFAQAFAQLQPYAVF